MKVEKLTRNRRPLLDGFDCGDDYFNYFFKSAKAMDDGIGTTYICLTDAEDKIIGCYNLTAGSMAYYDDGLLFKDSGAIHINYFAVDKTFQKNVEFVDPFTKEKVYTSDLLLHHCLNTIGRIRKGVLGVSYVTLRSSEAGRNLYERNGFSKIEADDGLVIPASEKEYDGIAMYLFLDET